MDTKKTLLEENQQCHQDHATWIREVEQWQKESEHLVALLYILERALPEHSALLKKHVSMIEAHEKLVSDYECGMDEHCLPTCPQFKTMEQQAEMHQQLMQLHHKIKQDHHVIKKLYVDEMEKFRSLLQRMLKEL